MVRMRNSHWMFFWLLILGLLAGLTGAPLNAQSSGTSLSSETPTIQPFTPSPAFDSYPLPYTITPSVPANVPSELGDNYWVEGFHGEGMDFNVYAVVSDNQGNVYAGGVFDIAGDVVVNNVAKWDGTRWHSLAGGTNGTVFALAIGPDGSLYAGGDFLIAGGVTVNHIARWDGTTWHPLGSGTTADVLTLQVDANGNLYAGGQFWGAGTCSGSAGCAYIARWDGAIWNPLESGMDDPVHTITLGPHGELYAGGEFLRAGSCDYSQGCNYIAQWNGVGWREVGGGAKHDVLALITDSHGNVYAGGHFLEMAGCTRSQGCRGIAKWDGLNWNPLNQGVNGSVFDLAVDANNDIIVVGGFNEEENGGILLPRIARWNGDTWSTLGNGTDRAIHAITVAGPNNIYIGGDFFRAGNESAHYFAHWDGTEWDSPGISGNGMNSAVSSIVANGTTSIYVAGLFGIAGGEVIPYLAQWDGNSWAPVDGNPNNAVEVMISDGNGGLYIAGAFTAVDGVPATAIAHWDGMNWHPLGSGIPGTGNPGGDIHELLVAPNGDLYVAGQFEFAGGVKVNNIARWDGTTWHSVGGGTTGLVRALLFDDNGDLYAGGAFSHAGGVLTRGIARWDGEQWFPLGETILSSGSVYTLSMDPYGALYAGGSFNAYPCANAESCNNLTRWDGTAWHAVGGGAGGTVLTLVWDSNGNLYAGGWFRSAGVCGPANGCNYIARWDGAEWHPLGRGMNQRVGSILPLADSLWVGGYFSLAGDKVSNQIARWDHAPIPPTPTVTNTPTHTTTPSQTATPSHTPSPSTTPTATLTPSYTATPSKTSTPIPTFTATATVTPTSQPTATATITPDNTRTPTSTPIPSHTPMPTLTPSAGATATRPPTTTVTPSLTATILASASATPTPTATVTATMTSVPATRTPTVIPPTTTPSSTATVFRSLLFLPLVRR